MIYKLPKRTYFSIRIYNSNDELAYIPAYSMDFIEFNPELEEQYNALITKSNQRMETVTGSSTRTGNVKVDLQLTIKDMIDTEDAFVLALLKTHKEDILYKLDKLIRLEKNTYIANRWLENLKLLNKKLQ